MQPVKQSCPEFLCKVGSTFQLLVSLMILFQTKISFKDTKQSNSWTKQVQKLFNSIGYSYLFNIQNDNSALRSKLLQIKQRIKDHFFSNKTQILPKTPKCRFTWESTLWVKDHHMLMIK